MKIAVYSKSGEKKEELTLSKAFDVEVGREAITLYINYLRNALRAPIANTKDRGAVSGGGKKPYRQKGTGNARAGSTRSPLWVGGGVTFGPTCERNFKTKFNSKEKKRIILSVFGDFIRNKKAVVITDLALSEPKTKKADEILNNLKAEGKISVISGKKDINCNLAFRNIAGIKMMEPKRLDMISVISSDQLILSKEALEEIEAVYSRTDK